MQKFFGTGVAIVTPFTQDLQVDIPALRRVTENQIEGKVEYLVVLGTTGESATLTPEEKTLVIETIFDQTDGRIPIVLGAGGNDTASICKQVEKYTRTYEADGILSVSPYYNKPSQEGIYQHYKAVAGATDLPVILYNVPPRTSSNVSAETTLRLAHDCSNVVAMKEASGSLEQCMAIIRDKPEGFQLLSGDDVLSIPLISLGGEGTISVTANALPADFSEMVRAAMAGDYAKANEIFYRIFPLIQLNFREGNPVGVKTLMSILGLCENHVRLPLVKGSSELERLMKDMLFFT